MTIAKQRKRRSVIMYDEAGMLYLKGKRFYIIRKDKMFGEKVYSISTTENGFQYSMVYRGILKNCKILARAFEQFGYKKRRRFY